MSNKGRATFNEYAILGEADDARLYFTASSGYSPRIQSATNDLTIQTNNGERMRINSSGNVGIGTTAPTQKLAVNGGLVSIGAIGSPGSAGSYTFNATALDYSNDGARSWSWGGSTYRGTFNWYQLENDGENQINSMRLDSSGNLLVGTTTAINSSHSIVKDSGVPLNIKRTTNASASNSLVLGYGTGGSTANLSIRGDGDLENTNGSYGFLASDERLKENIVDVSSQWEDVKNIKIKNFTLKHDSSGLVQMGAIAQELQEVCPNLIKSRETSAQDIENSGGLIKEGDEVLTYKLSIMQLKGFVALQEAMTKIEELTAKVEELESKIE
ncbi:MAG: hypothetical protein CM15mV44_0150 [uncultured marine virus]|nr:MAG: hypothetical protein CM15mV44_0150 [uncultured marine virus]